jgi:hypothetical protein
VKIKQEHATSLKEHEAHCERLQLDGVPKSRWPKKPTRALKPKPVLFPEGRRRDDDERAGDDDDDTV